MFNIQKYLEKFKKIGSDNEEQRATITRVLEKFSIPAQDFEVKDKVVKIRASSITKNQIYIQKSKILAELPGIVDII